MDELIYNQHRIPKNQWRYGLRPSSATGCGWIATHNALHLLGYRENIPDLIRYYESQLPLINGNLGTMICGPVLCFQRWGFPVETFFDPRQYDEAARAADVCILFYYWHRGLKSGAHFVALRHCEDGFVGYNTFRNSVGPDLYGPSLRDFLKDHGYFPSSLICIRKKPHSGI